MGLMFPTRLSSILLPHKHIACPLTAVCLCLSVSEEVKSDRKDSCLSKSTTWQKGVPGEEQHCNAEGPFLPFFISLLAKKDRALLKTIGDIGGLHSTRAYVSICSCICKFLTFPESLASSRPLKGGLPQDFKGWT